MKKYFVGIEWSQGLLRLSLLVATGNRFQALRIDRFPLSSETIETRPERIKTWAGENIPAGSDAPVVVSVPESDVFLKELELPNLSDKELAQAIQWELKTKSPTYPTSSLLEWQIRAKKAKGIAVAAMMLKEETAASIAQTVASAGLRLVAIEPSVISLRRLVTLPTETTLVVSLQGSEAVLVIIRNRIPVFSTSVALSISQENLSELHITRDNLALLASHIRQIISYWKEKESDSVKSIVLVSEAAIATGIRNELGTAIKLPVSVGSFKSSLVSPAKYGKPTMDACVISLGAATRAGSQSSGDVNFLPVTARKTLLEEETQRFIRISITQFIQLSVFFLILTAVLYGWVWYLGGHLGKDISQAQRFSVNHPGQNYVSDISNMNTTIEAVSVLMKNQIDMGAAMSYIASATPTSVSLTSIKRTGGIKPEWQIEGIGDRQGILAFYDKLVADKQVSTVTMPYSNFSKAVDGPFRIRFLWY